MPHFQSQGSRESNVAVSNNVFKFLVCFSVGVMKIAPSHHSRSRRLWVGKGCKKRERRMNRSGQVKVSWSRMLGRSTEKGLLGDTLLAASQSLDGIHTKNNLASPAIFQNCAEWWGFPSPRIHKEVNQEKRKGNSRCTEPSSKLTCSLTSNSRNINCIQLMPKKSQPSHLCRYRPLHNALQQRRWKVSCIGGRFFLWCDLKRWDSTEFTGQISWMKLSGTLVENWITYSTTFSQKKEARWRVLLNYKCPRGHISKCLVLCVYLYEIKRSLFHFVSLPKKIQDMMKWTIITI